jgi:hypothetical protein
MKNKILKTIEGSHVVILSIGEKKAAEDIATIYTLFIEWLFSNVDFDMLAEKQYRVHTETHVLEDMNLSEAFNYWWNNVKEK